MGTTRRRVTAILGLLAITTLCALPVSAFRLMYSSGTAGISVTSANTAQAFTDNHSAGTTTAFNARSVAIRSRSTSANACFFDLVDTVATTADARLAPGEWATATYDPSQGGDGWAGIGLICTAAETATFDVVATR